MTRRSGDVHAGLLANRRSGDKRTAPVPARTVPGVVCALLWAILLASVAPARAQEPLATVNFNNRVLNENISAPIFEDAVGGTLVEGVSYCAQLYSGPAGTPENRLVPTGAIVDFRTGLAAGFVNVGSEGTRKIPGVSPGSPAVVQIRVWTTSGGATYEQARANPAMHSKVGRSKPLVVNTQSGVLALPVSMVGLESFAITQAEMPVPQIVRAPANQSLFWPGDDLTYLVRWPVDGSTYDLQYSAELGNSANWQPVFPGPALDGTNYSVRIAAQAMHGYFRLKLR